jgi:predicted DNA-binding WGR domain protein
MQSYPHPEAAELVKLLPAKNHAKKQQAKFYRLAIWPDLFGGVSLVREYGYIGLEGQFRVDAFGHWIKRDLS